MNPDRPWGRDRTVIWRGRAAEDAYQPGGLFVASHHTAGNRRNPPFPPEVPCAVATSVKASRAAAVNAKWTISDFMLPPSLSWIPW